ncbi:MAG: hybrid sensor histidine kinase/response regulator, partial [Chlamydiia bacterium]|nr:hybrid sensor histidine kinase/response regulator [Chlamydiia bacterium]
EVRGLQRAVDQVQEALADGKQAPDVVERVDAVDAGLHAFHNRINDRVVELDAFVRRHSSLSSRLYREVIATRMRPFVDGVGGFTRMVRDLARSLDKQVELVIRGRKTPVDRDIIEKLDAPLTHILRNAVDHGIESPEERARLGKNPTGSIRLEARHRAGILSITVSDDGRGVDTESIRKKVMERGLVKQELASDLSPSELLEFLFLPGFSTADTVTEVSGRGVGLDVVQSVVQEVGGRIRIESERGQGLTYHMQLPLTLSVIRALLVSIGGEPYALPLSRIDRVLVLSPSDIQHIESRMYVHVEDQNIGILHANAVFGIEGPKAENEELSIVVISDRMASYGLVVERFLGERELVVQEMREALAKVPNISSGALFEDGSPLLIIDVEDLVRSMDALLGRSLPPRSVAGAGQTKQRRILVVEDSATVREVEQRLLAQAGYAVQTAVDGRDGWNALCQAPYDLVLTDLDMPRMNGFELIARIRSEPQWSTLPIVVVSYKDRQEDRQRALDLGANFYLSKSSFEDESLLKAIERLFYPERQED